MEALEDRNLLATISGTVFEDINGDGMQNPVELGMAGETVVLERVGISDPIATILNPAPEADDHFGNGLAALGNDILIGANKDNAAGLDTGTVYLFDGSTFDLIREFPNPDPEPGGNDSFGGARIAVIGDKFITASAFKTVGEAAKCGVAYLIDANNGELLMTYNNPTPDANDKFGQNVEVVGDRVAISAIGDSTAGDRSGAVYVFDIATGDLLTTIVNPTPGVNDDFGRPAREHNGDLLIAAPNDESDGNNCGILYRFDIETGDLLQTYHNPSADSSDQFGKGLLANGNTIYVASDQGQPNGGVVYALDATTGDVILTFNNPTPGAGDQFGVKLELLGDYLVVGARGDSYLGEKVGVAYMFDTSTGALLQTFSNPTPNDNDKFGSVRVVDGKIVISAKFDDVSEIDAGVAHVFEPVVTVTTDANGDYSFTDLDPDDYIVRQIVPEGFSQTAPAGDGTHAVTLATDQDVVGLDFGNVKVPFAQDDTFAVTQDASATVLDVLNNDLGAGLTIADFSQGSRGATVTGDGSQLEYTPDTGFVGQEALTYTITDGITESTGTVIVTVGTPDDAYIDFDDFEIQSFNGPLNDVEGTVTVGAEGATLHLVGNLMKAIDLSQTVTPYTLLEFDFRSSVEGEVHAIGTDLSLDPEGVFKVYGTQHGGYTVLDDYAPSSPDYKHYEVYLGDVAAGDMTKLWFMNDHDVVNPDSEGYFANVRLREDATRLTSAQDDSFAVAQDALATTLDVLANDIGTSLTIMAASHGSRDATVTIVGDQLQYTPANGFVGQEALTYTMTDGVTESTATVIVTVGTPSDAYIEFYNDRIFSYGGANDVEGTVAAEANGAAVHVTGNVMKAISLPHTVTANTVLEFDFRSMVEGEVHAIGTNLDNSASGVFKVHGRQMGGYTNLADYAASAPDYLHYQLYLGDYATGDMTKLWFMNDHDVPSPDSEGYFANVRIYEDTSRPATAMNDVFSVTEDAATTLDVLANDFGSGLSISSFSQGSQGGTVTEDAGQLDYTPAVGFVGQEALTYTMTDGVASSTGTVIVAVGTPADAYIDFTQYNVMSYGGANDVEGMVAVESDGDVLHIGGNVMKAIALPYTITTDTVLEFDFRSTMEGEVHAIGTNANRTASGVFKVHGTQNGAYTNLADYAPTAPEFKHYAVNLGDYGTGGMTRLWFMNDHDVPDPDSNGYFANVRIYEVAGAEGEPAAGSDMSGLLLPITRDEELRFRAPTEQTDQTALPTSSTSSQAAVDMALTGLAPPSSESTTAAIEDLFGGDENRELEDLLEEEWLGQLQ